MSKAMVKQESVELTGSFTRFYDMASGGGSKLDADTIYIQADYDDAVHVFERVFDRDPENVTCNCCGGDYSISVENNPTIENGSFVITKDDIKRLMDI